MSAETPIVTGYYRYTDIWWNWEQVLPNQDDVAPLKAIFAHDALVHEDHPLHIEGVQGAQLFIGTLENGESRLMFSSAQVDYIRYWLHEMGLTREIIPLPYSDCLLTTANLKNVYPITYATGGELRTAPKLIEKNNKRLKGSNPELKGRRFVFERVRTLWSAKKGVWCAIDFEDWELDHNIITEFGWSLFGWKDGAQVEETGHLVPSRAKNYRNSQYVKDNRDNYLYGQTRTVGNAEFITYVQEFVKKLVDFGPVFLVFHDSGGDLKVLNKLKAKPEGLLFELPTKTPDTGIFVVDTCDLMGALLGEEGNKRGLERMCTMLQTPIKFPHNAGNDAHHTFLALRAMAEGDSVDVQREKRWPGQTPAGVKVQLQPWQEESDYSDEEGLFPSTATMKLDQTTTTTS